jgi:RHS repeat-associated protein
VHTNVVAGGVIATYRNDNVSPHFRLTDWLGTTRAQTNNAGTAELTCQSLPFGDTSAQCAPATEQFYTGYERDAESGNDYAQARYYASSAGRFLSPDPSGLKSADPSNPQSFNLYSYVLNNPMRNIDPTGMECVWDDGSYDDQHDPDTGNDVDKNGKDVSGSGSKKCSAAGGNWVDHSFFNPDMPDWLSADDAANSGGEDQIALGLVGLLNGCTSTILSAFNSQTGTNLTTSNVTDNFYWGGAVNIDISATNLSAAQYNAIKQTRYSPPGFLGATLGIGPSLHLPAGPGNGSPSQDSPNTLPFTKQNGSVSTSAHIDSAKSDIAHPIGAAIHGSVDVAGAATRNPCP